jgi:hypothetical protein
LRPESEPNVSVVFCAAVRVLSTVPSPALKLRAPVKVLVSAPAAPVLSMLNVPLPAVAPLTVLPNVSAGLASEAALMLRVSVPPSTTVVPP